MDICMNLPEEMKDENMKDKVDRPGGGVGYIWSPN